MHPNLPLIDCPSKLKTVILWILVRCKGASCWSHRGCLPQPDITSRWHPSCHPLPPMNNELEGEESFCFRKRGFSSLVVTTSTWSNLVNTKSLTKVCGELESGTNTFVIPTLFSSRGLHILKKKKKIMFLLPNLPFHWSVLFWTPARIRFLISKCGILNWVYEAEGSKN